jgi:hypothetical protein
MIYKDCQTRAMEFANLSRTVVRKTGQPYYLRWFEDLACLAKVMYSSNNSGVVLERKIVLDERTSKRHECAEKEVLSINLQHAIVCNRTDLKACNRGPATPTASIDSQQFSYQATLSKEILTLVADLQFER